MGGVDVRAAVLPVLLAIGEPPDLLVVVDQNARDLETHLGIGKPHEHVPSGRHAGESRRPLLDPPPRIVSAVLIVEIHRVLPRMPLEGDPLVERPLLQPSRESCDGLPPAGVAVPHASARRTWQVPQVLQETVVAAPRHQLDELVAHGLVDDAGLLPHPLERFLDLVGVEARRPARRVVSTSGERV